METAILHKELLIHGLTLFSSFSKLRLTGFDPSVY